MMVQPAQRGHGLLLLLLLLIIGGGASLALSETFSRRLQLQAQQRSIHALAQARTALIGYAISYAERHPGQDYGYLPCPDLNNSGSSTLGACGNRDQPAIGRLPWRTLALPELRDGHNECLWYAVAGSVKHNPKPLSLNWDSPGQFVVVDDAGQTLELNAADGRAIALIIAPGKPRPGQSRLLGNNACRGADDAATALADFINPLPTVNDAGELQFQRDNTDASAMFIAWLSIDDLFAALRRRHDFAGHLNQIIARAASSLAARLDEPGFIDRHTALSASGLLRSGPLPPASTLGLNGEQARLHNNWRNQFWLTVCSDHSPCIRLEQSSSSLPSQCRGVLLFGGERIGHGSERQQRHPAAEQPQFDQFFEGDNARNLALGIPHFAGAGEFRIDNPLQAASEDVVRCLH